MSFCFISLTLQPHNIHIFTIFICKIVSFTPPSALRYNRIGFTLESRCLHVRMTMAFQREADDVAVGREKATYRNICTNYN